MLQEIWTLCRIFKRSASYRKCAPDWRSELGSKRTAAPDYSTTSKTCSSNSSSITSSDRTRATLQQNLGTYISFGNKSSSSMPPHQLIINTTTQTHDCTKPYSPQILNFHNHNIPPAAQSSLSSLISPSSLSSSQATYVAAPYSVSGSVCEFLRRGADWEDLRSVVLDSTATVNSGNSLLNL